MENEKDKRFIIWDPSDGPVRVGDDGEIISDGLTGRMSIDNVYLTAYPSFRDKEERRPKDLDVGEKIEGVIYGLSGGSGVYDIYRVR
jgi:hypothetical protein